jgi:hypothetical protein
MALSTSRNLPERSNLHPRESAATFRAPVTRSLVPRIALLFAATATAACSAPTATVPADGNGPPAANVAPGNSRAAAPALSFALPSAAPPSAAAPSAAPAASSSIAALASARAAPAPSAAASAEAPSPASASPEAPVLGVKVTNIGMHIGGGPNDAPTKEPIRRSIEPHFDAFRRCFAKVEVPKKGGNFSIDLRIDRSGGKARVSHPRTSLKGKDFEECVLHVFEAIDFLKPKGGSTVVSYSLQFTP